MNETSMLLDVAVYTVGDASYPASRPRYIHLINAAEWTEWHVTGKQLAVRNMAAQQVMYH